MKEPILLFSLAFFSPPNANTREKRYATNSAALRVAGFGTEPGFYYLSQYHRMHPKLNMRASCRKTP